MTLGVHQVDGRIAANSAIKIRAALLKSVDAKKVITDYAHTHPTVSEFVSQDRARARAWAIHNVTLNHTALDLALRKHYADMYVTGVLSAYDAYGKASRSRKAVKTPPHNWADAWAVNALSNAVNWDTWKPGNEAAAALLKPPGGLEKLLNGIKIKSLDMKKTSYDLLGSQLADGLAIGASPTNLASMIENSLSSPERSLMIALTEGSRAANTASLDAYQALGVEQIEWVSADPDDEECDIGGEITDVDGEFSNGLTAEDLPVHPNCRCSTLPLVPELRNDSLDSNADN